MKKAFTMLELVFVIVIIGVLSYFVTASFERSSLREAADQVIGHIRYTQHLAMSDDKFIPTVSMSKYTNLARKNKEPQYYYKGRWQLNFFNVAVETPANSFTAYVVFSDSPNTVAGTANYDGNPNQSGTFNEVARNPQDPTKYLIGANHASFTLGDEHISKEMNLNTKYGVQLVSFLGSCNGAHRIAFDYIGRPIGGDLATSPAVYEIGRLLTTPCQIVLCANNPCDDQNITIAIEPETGYTHIQ
ncbi:MAG: type II secretion system protein [Sulfurospirillaceae bacterium]|nr:type II secretion system protein [Sulfurospirillaceae bacterium]